MKSLLLFALITINTTLVAQPWPQLVKDVCPGICSTPSYYYTSLNGLVYYAGWQDLSGSELWVTDGTPANTRMVKEINTMPIGTGLAGSAYPNAFCPVNNKLIFCAKKSNNANYTLWASDGTAAGTIELKPGLAIEGGMILPFNGKAYFILASGPQNIYKSLWVTDGTIAGTKNVAYLYDDQPVARFTAYTIANNRLFYSTDFEEWIRFTTGSGHMGFQLTSKVEKMASFQNKAYFVCENGKLYATDGVSFSATLVSDLGGPLAGKVNFLQATPTGLVIVNNKIWKSDGTSSGTTIIASPDTVSKTPIIAGNNIFYTPDVAKRAFLTSTDLNTGATTVIDTTITLISHNGGKEFIHFHDRLYFEGIPITTAANGAKTYGKPALYSYHAGNGKIQPVAPISVSSTIFDAASIGDELFLSANDGVNGVELWKITDFPTEIAMQSIRNDISIYPNPAHSMLTLQLPGNSAATYKIINLLGQTQSEGLAEEKTVIDISYLPVGIYCINVSITGMQILTKRFIKE